jgi:hypothetical protein
MVSGRAEKTCRASAASLPRGNLHPPFGSDVEAFGHGIFAGKI